jgi:hypothetical protein
MEVCGQLQTPAALPHESFIAKYIGILLGGVLAILFVLLCLKGARKEEYPGDRFSSNRTGVLKLVYSCKCM